MATFEEHIEGLTQIDITSSSAPNQTELTGFLVNGVIDCVNKMIQYKPKELSKFTKTTNATDSVAKKGKVLSVLREHDSQTILRVCTPIPPQLRYEATDVESLHYRSKYNPGYYELNGLIICVPEASGSGNNDIVVTQVHYDTGLINSDEYNGGVIENFPLDYEYLVALYAAAKSCQAAASDIQNNMPTKPTPPHIPVFDNTEVDMPLSPVVSTPELKIDFGTVNSLLGKEDLDAADKAFTRIEKELDIFSKKLEIDNAYNGKNSDIFKAEMEKIIKDADRDLQVQAGEYRSAVLKYQNDISFYGAEVSEKVTRYKWYIEQYVNLMNQYNMGTMPAAKQLKKQPQQSQPKKEREGER